MEATMLLDREASRSDSLGRNYIWQQNNAAWLGSVKLPITRFHSDRYHLSKPPLFVQVESYSDGYLVIDDDVDRHGVGRTIGEALLDYEETLLGYFGRLNEHYPKLSNKLKKDLEFLNQIITRT